MEAWRIIRNYPNYSVSDKGNVRNNITKRILKFGLSGNSIKYYRVNLYNSNGMCGFGVHQLVHQEFNEALKKGYIVDHIDDNPTNNTPSNLQQITNRENVYKHSLHKGVIWEKARNKWLARLRHNKKLIYIGRYDDIEVAKKAYKDKFNEIVK
jgi:hypothetical protein